MNNKTLDVFGIGNAIVDMLVMVSDDFLEKESLAKGGMMLMETDRQARILHGLAGHDVKLASGGSAANTMVAVAQSGGTGAYFGKVAHDTHGEFYAQDMEESGIRFPIPLAPEVAAPTGTCVVLTTPDAERTMCTHLGISTNLTVNDLDWDLLAQCQFSYIEGYLWDAEGPRQACLETMKRSAEEGVRAAFTFSDPFLVERYREDFLKVVPEHCEVLFCNADEGKHLLKLDSVEKCAEELGGMAAIVFVTDGPNGCYVCEQGKVTHVPGFAIKALDTVGAGDAFAGGALYGLARGMDAVRAAKWGNYMASEVVARVGPRLQESQANKLESVLGAGA